MTLEDFFTLTEIKDGLTAPSRVEELAAIMQKDKEFVVKNVVESTRQWAAVASTIAATKNKDCLDLFIQLDGLWYLDRWLKDAQRFSSNLTDSIVEESIVALLRALENLNIDSERSISSGVRITVQGLLGSSSSQVQDIARALFDSWKQDRVSDTVQHSSEGAGAYCDRVIKVHEMIAEESRRLECSVYDVPLLKQSAREESLAVEVPKAENLGLKHLEDLKTKRGEAIQTRTEKNELQTSMDLDNPVTKDMAPDNLPSSLVPNTVHENHSVKEKYPVSITTETIPMEARSCPLMKQGSFEGQSDALELDKLSKDYKQITKRSGSSEKLGIAASVSSIVEPGVGSSGADVARAQETETGLAVHKQDSASEVKLLSCEPNSELDDKGVTNNCGKQLSVTSLDRECHSDTLQDSSAKDYTYGKSEELDTYSRMEDSEATDEDKEHTSSDGGKNTRSCSSFSRTAIDNHTIDVIDNQTTDIELDYGIVDALEVARKVAQEVEREVIDYREPSCSSSEKVSDGIRQPNSPESINGKQDLPNEMQQKEMPSGQNHSAEKYPEGQGRVINSGNLDRGPENGINDIESSQVTEAIQEPEINTEKSMCDFDLNQEICSDDVDHTVNSISTPIPVVSASRPVGTPGLPFAPLQFEGTLGWKGSAATSAFRPASPRRPSCGGKALSTGEASNSLKVRLACLDIDLNVAESGDEKLVDLMSGKQYSVSSGLQSAESSLEMSPKRSERLKLDLNRTSDDGDAFPSDLRVEGRPFYNRNGHRSPSPVSSSSSMQPSLRNIDLNDRPHVHVDSSDQGPCYGGSSQSISAFVGPKSDEPAISIMGKKVEINRKDFLPQVSSLPNGKSVDPAVDTNLARAGGTLGLGPAVSYTHSPMFGYNGLTGAPGMPFSSTLYGPGVTIPYMVDSRGAPVVPQIVGSASVVPPTYSQPPFIMSMTSAPPGLNGSGASRPSFDLNTGFAVEGGNREPGSLRHLFMAGQSRSMEDHLRVSSQASSSSVGGKRKEPDGGWESYAFNYRHHQQPPWK